ncbi:DUF1993 domain-containing protein [Pseudomonas sp. 39167]|uniref:DUF1993 domain-containing protein n=1 Tax=Pseudomonas sp. 39167 TaxID=2967215 RepID=UPI002363E14F|nr:DUF1993 domain-containing protein [Pseudomonas sp. 39167]MDD2034546.1 DUF1993 domain-containing protein [Pseudomonas sp. 39167]
MTIAIFDITLTPYRRVLSSLADCLDLGLAHCMKQGVDPENIKFARLTEDMNPFDFQVQAVVHHCVNGAKALVEGTLGPVELQDMTYVELTQYLRAADRALSELSPSDVNEAAGRIVTFRSGEFSLQFTTENFVLAFSLPNLYFHATTAYDILRMRGVMLGKKDYLGILPIK